MDRRALVGILCVSALLLLISAVTKSWYTASNSRGDRSSSMGLGLWGTVEMEECRDGHCQSRSVTIPLDQIKKGSMKTGIIAGRIGLVASLAGAGLLCVLAFMIGTRNAAADKLKRLALGATSIALVSAVMFLSLVESNGSSFGFSAYVFFIGVAGAYTGGSIAPREPAPALPAASYQGAA